MALLDKEFLTYNDLAELLNVDHTTVRRWVSRADSNIPRPYKISHRKVLFKTSEIEEWLHLRRG